jgi:HK97 family phage portal protein
MLAPPPRRQGIFRQLLGKFGLETKGELASPDPWFFELFAGDASPSLAGITVSPLTAMSCAPVRCAVQAIAETVGQLPVMVYQRGENGAKERYQDHPAYALLHDAPNDWTPASTFIEQITRDALLERWGGFAFINRVGGKPVELIRLDPFRTPVIPQIVNGEPAYQVTEAGSTRLIGWRDMLHIPTPSHSAFGGLLHDARQAIGLCMVMEAYAARLFGNGARPSGILKFKGKLDAASSARMKASWQAAHGAPNSGGTAIIEEDGEWQALTLNSVDSQFLEMRKFAVEEIARHFRVPSVFLMDYGRATWSNAEAMGNQFLTFTLLPWIKRWEGEILLKLFTPEERKLLFAEFNTDALLRADFDKRMEGWQKAIAARIVNPNEARAAENRPPYVGGDKFENPNTASPLPVVPA